MGMGLELGLIIGGLTFLGYLGDKRWGTEPWLALAGALISTIGGCYNLIKEAAKMPTPGNTPGSKEPKPASKNASKKTTANPRDPNHDSTSP